MITKEKDKLVWCYRTRCIHCNASAVDKDGAFGTCALNEVILNKVGVCTLCEDFDLDSIDPNDVEDEDDDYSTSVDEHLRQVQ